MRKNLLLCGENSTDSAIFTHAKSLRSRGSPQVRHLLCGNNSSTVFDNDKTLFTFFFLFFFSPHYDQ